MTPVVDFCNFAGDIGNPPKGMSLHPMLWKLNLMCHSWKLQFFFCKLGVVSTVLLGNPDLGEVDNIYI